MPNQFSTALKLSFLVLSTSAPWAFAAPPGKVPLVSDTEPSEAHHPSRQDSESGAQFLAARLDTLRTALRLKPEQEPAWQKWTASVKAAPQNWKEKHPNAPALSKMTVPERLEKLVEFARERLARLEERLAETKAFYAALTPEQQQTFNKDFNFWPHGGRGQRPAKSGKALIGPRIGTP